ncbi:MAG: hypothetical protein LBC60_10325, partial [Spirochaetaceae bacterium]|nr:hypothetical protein [Spirochaetaceae bacterium]
MTRYRFEEKTKLLEDWRGSGKKAWIYAKEKGINPQTFSKWTKREAGPGFVEVKQTMGTGIKPCGNEILIEKGDLRIHLPLGISV